MVRRARFGRGDIVTIDLDPTSGHEQRWTRPALGIVLVAPITQGGDFARHAGFASSLTGAGTKTQGVALVNQIRMLDLEARQARRVETAPEFVIEDALARLRAITE